MELYSTDHLSSKQKAIKEKCEEHFYSFVQVVDPTLCTGHIHEDVCNWIQTNMELGITHSLLLLPRAHLKSRLAALYACWRIIRRPWITILYGSASSDLAEKQLYFITNILLGPDVSFYWKGLINEKKNERDKWRTKAINVDHQTRKDRNVRDYTIRTLSVGSTIAGDHYELCLLDDIIAPNSDADPWTEPGRLTASRWYAQLASVMNPGTELMAVGTRYHKKDIYQVMAEESIRIYDERGEILESKPKYAVMNKVVETNGQFLWPRIKSFDGEWYGFNESVLDSIRESYRRSGQMEQFYAQYYQNPSDKENPKIPKNFIYYEKDQLQWTKGKWHYKYINSEGLTNLTPLNLFAAMDLAFSTREGADYTAIIVCGIDSNDYRYVVDIDRFRTRDPYIMLEHLFALHEKWGFTKCRIETTAGQMMFIPLVQKEMSVRNQRFIIEEFKPLIKKEERIMSVISPLVQLQQLFLFRGGLCEELEKQLIEQKPEHDDIADVLASVQEIMYKPSNIKTKKEKKIIYNNRFGGVQEVQIKSGY